MNELPEADTVGLNPHCGYPKGLLHNFWWHRKDKSLESFCMELAFELQVPDDLPKGKTFILRVTQARPVAWSIAQAIRMGQGEAEGPLKSIDSDN